MFGVRFGAWDWNGMVSGMVGGVVLEVKEVPGDLLLKVVDFG